MRARRVVRADPTMSEALSTRLLGSLEAVAPEVWNALVGDDDPFVEHAFLVGLERSRSVGRGTGWRPTHLGLYRGDELVGALALYEKEDSWGEFVFDFAWARAAGHFGVRYYPKLVSMVPFTPATGRRVLVRADVDAAEAATLLAEAAFALAQERRASSVHLLYLDEPELEAIATSTDYAHRVSLQFHWENQGYASFDAFLETFRASARKQVRRERREVAASGVDVRVKRGTELDDADWKAVEIFYRMNVARHGSYAYLTPPFFTWMREALPERVLAVLAYREGEAIAGSLNFTKGKHLYGRYWGATDEVPFLHFECCYYRLIEYAIEHGLTRFEAGAQGHHKLKRGLLPSPVHSAHRIVDARLGREIGAFLEMERAAMEEEHDALLLESPLRRG